MKKAIKKGYTLTVTSWENDGDYEQTKSKTVDTKKEAKALYDLMQLCKSENNQPKGVIKLGNTIGFSEEQENLIVNFFKNNPILIPKDVDEEDLEDTEFYLDLFYEITSDLLGDSEWYNCRVMESCKVTYSDADVKLKTVKL